QHEILIVSTRRRSGARRSARILRRRLATPASRVGLRLRASSGGPTDRIATRLLPRLLPRNLGLGVDRVAPCARSLRGVASCNGSPRSGGGVVYRPGSGIAA